jgi:tripartite-type tricarboxylate transporter receptor subunit TctC
MIISKTKAANLIMLFLILTFLVGEFNHQALAASSSAADFYKDKKITYIVASKPGGGTDLIARLIAPYVKKYTDAYSVVVDNVAEGGGLLALNRLWNSKPDGLTIATSPMDNVVGQEVIKAPGVQYQTDKFNVIFALNSAMGEALVVNANGPFRSVDDLKKAKGLKSASLLAGAVLAAYIADVLGLDAKITTGMATGDATLALQRGEIQFVTNSPVSTLKGIADGTELPLCVTISAGIPVLPQAPPLAKFATLSPQQKEWGKIFDVTDSGKYVYAGPNVPQERIDYLRTVFEKIHQDPQFLQDRKKFEQYPGTLPWLNGAEAQRVSTTYLNLSKGEANRQMVEYLSKKYFAVK